MQDDARRGAIEVVPPAGGFDRPGIRRMLLDAGLPRAVHGLVEAPFGHTPGTLAMLEALVEALDLAVAAGGALHAALLDDIARTGSLAIPDPTDDQRRAIGAFTVTVFCDAARARLSELAPLPQVDGPLEQAGLGEFLLAPPVAIAERLAGQMARYLDVQVRRTGGPGSTMHAREAWIGTTLCAFATQLREAVLQRTRTGALRPFDRALAMRRVRVGPFAYAGFSARPLEEPVTDLRPIRPEDIVGNDAYVQAGLRLARDVAGYDFERGENPKKVNPVLFGLGRPGCGKTITAHAIGTYFLEYCAARGVPARFRVIRRTDWASSYQNASAANLVRIFREEVYGFDGVCGVYWPDIDTAFASRDSGDLRMEEKQNLGAVFGIFDGTLLPKDGKWFLVCDANYMQMDEATVSRIAQNPFVVEGATEPDEYVRLLRDILLRDVARFVETDEAGWRAIGERLAEAGLSGRAVESIAGNVRAKIQDFEFPDAYFSADFDERKRIVEAASNRIGRADVEAEIDGYVRFQKEAEEREAAERFERQVSEMVERLNAGRAAAARLAGAAAPVPSTDA
ncbi:MAG: AAA family ATPase [Deltaproteobacteria bacterium]|nr:MAG: AAA family ATPase [Deltaproteobacteria bacterium]